MSLFVYFIVTLLAVVIGGWFLQQRPPQPPTNWTRKVTNFETDVVYVFTVAPLQSHNPSSSPFATKLLTYLREHKIKHVVDNSFFTVMGPKKKTPWIELNGQAYTDSTLIINKLDSHFNLNTDGWLSPADKALAHSVQVMCEERLYFILLHYRWTTEEAFSIVKALFFPGMPAFIAALVCFMIRKDIRSELFFQGIGRHSEQEILQFGQNDIVALSNILGDKKFFFGDRFSTYDAAIFGQIDSIVHSPFTHPLADFVRANPNLVHYADRIRAKLFPEYHQGPAAQ